MPYLLGGALAAAVWGEPRSTLDVDLVISLQTDQIEPLSTAFRKRGILIPPDVMQSQLDEQRGDLAIVGYHLHASYKVEMFPLRAGDALRASALQRRQTVELDAPLGRVYVHSPEDLILYKLQYFDLSAQTKHVRDIVSICLARGPELDYAYLRDWVGRLGLQRSWQHMLAEARHRGAQLPPEA